MSILVAKLKNEETTSLLKKIIDALLEIAEALVYEEYRDSAFAKFLEQSKNQK
jgi:hypothetical protein